MPHGTLTSTWRSVGRALLGAAALATLVPMVARAGEDPSVARQWNEELLHAIRNDFARPTVHARNLFHTAIAMYDAWAAYDDEATTFLLGKTVDGYSAPFAGIPEPGDVQAAREEALSFACYRLLTERFRESPGDSTSLAAFDALMNALNYDRNDTSTDYQGGSPAALGNYLAQQIMFFGFDDRANEQGRYGNLYYQPVNAPLAPELAGNPDITDLNRWQPLALAIVIDQSGNEVPGGVPIFLSPEWGAVTPFSLHPRDRVIRLRDGFGYPLYHDPGAPPELRMDGGGLSPEYQWGFALVSIWSSHLDPSDGVMWDISPGALGNIGPMPETIEGYRDFYLLEGGDTGTGHAMNPHTGAPYAPNVVPRGDYSRVLAEFWADGPDSETPPGHWFVILNYVNDHPLFEKRFEGKGPVLDPLEWDVKAYFALAGAMHDAAVSAWGIKGWYDYIRPVSALRAMADLGQSTHPDSTSYHPAAFPSSRG